MDFDGIIGKLVEESKLSKEEVLKLVEEKKTELSGLVSDVGAAHIVANELGIQTLPSITAFFRVEDLRAGLSNVDLTVRVLTNYGIREFVNSKTGKPGKVANILVGDETGTCRLVLWGAHTDELKEVAKDDIVKVTNAYVKMDRNGHPEAHCGDRSKTKRFVPKEALELPERVKALPDANEILANAASKVATPRAPRRIETKKISELKDGEFSSIRATVIKIIQRSPFYDVCPQCSKSASGGVCREHGKVESKKALIVTAVLDDGTGSVRAVFFRDAAEKLLDKKLDEALKEAKESGEEAVFLNPSSIGREFAFLGRAKKNDMFDRIELMVNQVSDVDVEAEIKRLLDKKDDDKDASTKQEVN